MIVTGLAWFLAWLFARAALHKLRAVDYYRVLIGRYLGTAGSAPAVYLLAVVESVVAVLLVLPHLQRLGLVLAALFLLFYGALMALKILFGGADMQCGCSGPDSPLQLSWALVLRNLVCAGLASLALARVSIPASDWLHWPGSFGVALIAATAYLFCEALISNAQFMAGED